MAFVNVGSLHSESKSLTVIQQGKSTVSVALRNDLLSSDSSEWLIACESLQVPLDGTRYFDGVNTELFNLRRLRHNTPFTVANTYLYDPSATIATDISALDDRSLRAYTLDTLGRVRTDRFEVRNIGDFIEMLVQWYQRINVTLRGHAIVAGWDGGARFNQEWDQTEATKDLLDAYGDPVMEQDPNQPQGTLRIRQTADEAKRRFEHFRVRVGASGNIQFIMSQLFASLFYIEVSPYAQEIFGLPEIISWYVQDAVPVRRTNTEVGDALSIVDGANLMQSRVNAYLVGLSDWTLSLATAGTQSIFSSIDTRLSIALSTDLQLQRSLVIVDEHEQYSYMIYESPLDNEVQIQNTVSDQFHSEFHISTRSRAGQFMVKRSSDPITEWVALASDIGVRSLRLRLYIRERIFVSKGVWKIVLSPLPVESHTSWSCKLLFAKRTH